MSLLTLNFPVDQNFEPTAETKDKILYTHKTTRQFAGISIPGIFQTTNHTLHLIAFFLIFFIEGVATWYCKEKGGVDITAIIIAILVDIILAILSHLPHKEIIKLKNQLIFSEGTIAINIQRRISKLKMKQNLFYVLIFVLAGFKIYWFWTTYDIIDTTTLLIIVSYTLAAVMHIAFTGFALFGIFVSIFLNSDYSEFIKSNGIKNFYNLKVPLKHIFETQLELVECVVNDKHKLVKIKSHSYQFETFGLLTDKDLVEFVMKQSDANQKREVIVEGIKHQLTILQTDPNK